MSASRKRGPSRGPARGKGPAKGPGRGPAKGPGKGPARGAKRPPGSTRKPAPKRAIRVTPIDDGQTGDGKVRLNRYLAQSGLCSRRAADELIEAGRITINDEIVTELGTRVDPKVDDIRYDGEKLKQEPPVYLLFNKPKGVVCTNANNEQRRRVIDYLPGVKGRVYTVGRLDADSEGLILLTNDGEFAQRIAHPSFGLAKTYAVLVSGRVESDVIEKAQGGVWLSDGRTGGAKIVIERRGRDRTYMKVSLREGRNREIRRVFARLGFKVLSLKRVRIGQLSLHGLGQGRYRFLRPDEVDHLVKLTEGDAAN